MNVIIILKIFFIDIAIKFTLQNLTLARITLKKIIIFNYGPVESLR